MNKKEEEILKKIIEYNQKNNSMPSIRYLQKTFNYKSATSIARYIKSLENQKYLTRNNFNKLILNNYSIINDIKHIKIINANNKVISIILEKSEKYIAYKIHNNYFNNIGILRNDILIIKIKKELNKNDLGLFIIDNKYRIMKYDYKDGFYILKDNEEMLLNKVKIVGKVIMIERKLWEAPKVFSNIAYY